MEQLGQENLLEMVAQQLGYRPDTYYTAEQKMFLGCRGYTKVSESLAV